MSDGVVSLVKLPAYGLSLLEKGSSFPVNSMIFFRSFSQNTPQRLLLLISSSSVTRLTKNRLSTKTKETACDKSLKRNPFANDG